MKKKIIYGYMNNEGSINKLIEYNRWKKVYIFGWTLVSQEKHLIEYRKVKKAKRLKITIEEAE